MHKKLHCKQHTDHRNQGFFIFEAIVYMALISICMVIFMRALVDVMNHTKTSGADAYNIVSATTAIDTCVRDLWKGTWDDVVPTDKGCVIITNDTKDYGWEMDKGALYRVEGKFDRKNNQWGKRKRNKITSTMESFVCRKNNDHSTVVIEAVYNATYKLSRCVRFKQYEG